ncbi:MAG: bifunctional diaminohydroxyphosphoribosylaminopyrimidine deaminase/5-amino-6-(5-phosphoribosylamino)uracil reductase RibD [Planctomycetia bacterium]|nr:bifunctional diaminohydroxyphosphoribosylaminopyrimidine deaminase/5-amino-6-(5-phosphoribosylamino)uracil reductase RibD [Planctomycetia bacterium]
MTDTTFASREAVMGRAIELARRGVGLVEPNPAVGAVVVDDSLHLVGEGWHEKFGGPHAEVAAIARAGAACAGGTLYVTLEPCCHVGKTPPCVDAVIAAGLRRVVVAMVDPFPQVAGKGIQKLREAGIDVEVGLLESQARRLTAPFRKLVERGIPYVHAKWAMTLDGKIASPAGDSKWISHEASRARVHALRGRMDAILVGIGTALADDPLLTARPAGPRVATRVVLDSRARLPIDSQLVRTVDQAPLVVAVGSAAPAERIAALESRGVEVLRPSNRPPAATDRPELRETLLELGRRQMTNLLVEGGGEILGSFFDGQFIDEVHVFLAPKLLGGAASKSPVAGEGRSALPILPDFESLEVEAVAGDIYLHGPLRS